MKYLTKNKHWRLTEEYNINKLLYLLIDRPTSLSKKGSFLWRNDNNVYWHRGYDLPACISSHISYTMGGCDISWWKNDNRHRENNKPAIITYNGELSYWINNIFQQE